MRLLGIEYAAPHAAKFGLIGETEVRAVFGLALLIVKRRGEIMRAMQHVYVEEMQAPDGESLH
ncbi:hypothetical protein [Mesorhizobium sp. IMUNJ 23232]|uniref:hypothetical protein n=1 Tax=Mesorhizobium sp. IMUNJ 23232 TaxID=3376064 RepID=UPI0037B014BE